MERLNLRNLWLSGPSLARLEAGLETKVLWLPISIHLSRYLSIYLSIYYEGAAEAAGGPLHRHGQAAGRPGPTLPAAGGGCLDI